MCKKERHKIIEMKPYHPNTEFKSPVWGWDVSQVVEHMHCLCEPQVQYHTPIATYFYYM